VYKGGSYNLGKGSLLVSRSVRDMSPSRSRYRGHSENDGGVTMDMLWLGTMAHPHYAADPSRMRCCPWSGERYAPTRVSRQFQTCLRTHRSDPHKTAKAAKAAALCRQHSEADLRRLVREMAVGASHVIIRVARDSDEMQGKRNLLTTHGQGAMP
jgi:hypothetical protein